MVEVGEGNPKTVRESVNDLVNFSISAQPINTAVVNYSSSLSPAKTSSPVDTSQLKNKTVYMVIESNAAGTATVAIESSPNAGSDSSNWVTEETYTWGTESGLPVTKVSAVPLNDHYPSMRAVVRDITASSDIKITTSTVYITGGI